jgi:hypothetical protein
MKKQVALRLREPFRWGRGIIGLWTIRRLCVDVGVDVWTRQHSKDLSCSRQIFFADEDFEAGAGPGEMFAHSAGGVGTQHGADSGVFEQAYGEVGLRTAAEGLDKDELGVVHDRIIRLGLQVGDGAFRVSGIGYGALAVEGERVGGIL